MSKKSSLTLFTVYAKVTYPDLRRDWEGWVEGHGPSTDKTLPPQDVKFRVACLDADTALARVRQEIDTGGQLEIQSVREDALLAVIYKVEV